MLAPARITGRKDRPRTLRRLIVPHCVKPFLKPQKNDAANAEANAGAAVRVVEPKTAEQQARAIAFVAVGTC